MSEPENLAGRGVYGGVSRLAVHLGTVPRYWLAGSDPLGRLTDFLDKALIDRCPRKRFLGRLRRLLRNRLVNRRRHAFREPLA